MRIAFILLGATLAVGVSVFAQVNSGTTNGIFETNIDGLAVSPASISVTGDASVGGNLSVTGTSSLVGATTITGSATLSSGATLGGDLICGGNDVVGYSAAQTSDTATGKSTIKAGQDAYAIASSNTSGGATHLSGGLGTKAITIARIEADADSDTIAIVSIRDGATTTTTLTAKNGGASGATQFNCKTNTGTCADNLYDLLSGAGAISGITPVYVGGSSVVGLTCLDCSSLEVTITDAGGGAGPVGTFASGADGGVIVQESLQSCDGACPTWGHSPGLAVENAFECNGMLYADAGAIVSGASLDVQGQMITEGDGTYSWDHTPSGFATEGTIEVDGAAYFDDDVDVVDSLTCGDLTVDESTGVILFTGATSGTLQTQDLSTAAATATLTLKSGNQSNAGDYASGVVVLASGTSATLGDTGNVSVYSGNAADTSGNVAVYSGTSANTAEQTGTAKLYSGAQSHATGGVSGAVSVYSGSAAGTAASGGVDLYTGAQTNAGDYASGAVNIYTGATTTDGNSGNITLKTGAAGAGASDAGSIYFQTHGANTRVSIAGSTGKLTAEAGADVKGDMITEGDGTYSWGHSPTGIGTEGSIEVDGMAYLDGGATLAGPFVCSTGTIAADDATPSVAAADCLTTSANVAACEITDLDSVTSGQTVLIIGGSNTNSSTISDAGNFNLDSKYGAMTLSVDSWIALYVQADNDYIEVGRGDNSAQDALTVASLTMGSATVDTGDIVMIKGAQTSDPQVTLALSADGVGAFSITTASGSDGDIKLSPSGGDVHIGADDSAKNVEIHSGGTFKIWDASDDTSVLFDVDNGTTELDITGSINVSGGAALNDAGLTVVGDVGTSAAPAHTAYFNTVRIGPDSFTADSNYALHINTATAGGGFRVTGTHADAAGINMVLHHDSVSPAASDVIGQQIWNGEDSASNETEYAKLSAEIVSPTSGAESGLLRLYTQENAASTEYLRLDGTAGVTGIVASKSVVVSEAKGQSTTVSLPITTVLTCDSAATLSTAADFIPSGVYLHGISTRITSAGLTGPTSMDIGDGSIANLWGDDETVANDDVTDNTDATANWSNPILANSAVVLTWNGGNCTAGTIRVSAHVSRIVAPTAD